MLYMDLIAKQNDMNTTNESNTSSRERIYITIYVTNFLSLSAYYLHVVWKMLVHILATYTCITLCIVERW